MNSLIGQKSKPLVCGYSFTDVSPYLKAILASTSFRRARRLKNFLTYLVLQSLEPRTDLKEYAIGIEVFDRSSDFDPRLDPIVRVEARRLRAKLSNYYAGEGAHDGLRISMPGGGYRVAFLRPEQTNARTDLTEPGRPIRRVSLAVLPFVSLNTKRASQLFADGLTDEVSFQLASGSDLQVVARTSAFQFRGQPKDVRTIGAALNADFVLEGSIAQEGKTTRVLLQLASSSSGFRLWSGRYQDEQDLSLSAQSLIASKVANELRSLMETTFRNWQARLHSSNAALLELYQKGRRLLNSRTEEGINQGITCFQRSIDSDSNFALGHAGLADSYSLGSRYHVLPAEQSWEKARTAALAAVRIDASLAEAYTSLAFVELHYLRDSATAERSFCTAIQLNPQYAPARQWYAWCLAASGRPQLAVANLRTALDLDAFSPNVSADLALALYFERDYGASIAQCEKTLRISPGFHRAHQQLGLAYLQTGDHARALEQFRLATRNSARNSRVFAWMAQAYAALGATNEVKRLRDELLTTQERRMPAIDFALLSVAAGEYDLAFEWLNRASTDDDGELIWLPIDPIYDGLRRDPRFSVLLGRLGPRA